MDQLPGLSVVLPCFNEIDNVAEAIDQAGVAARRVAVYANGSTVSPASTMTRTIATTAARSATATASRILMRRRRANPDDMVCAR